MKKFKYALFAALSLSALLLAGCAKTDSPESQGSVSAPTETPAPTATPTPAPTPIPYDLAAENLGPGLTFAADYGQVSGAYAALDQPEADPWAELFAANGAVMASAPEVSRIGDHLGEGDILAAGDFLFLLDQKDLVILASDSREEPVLSRTRVGIDWTGGESDNGTNVSGYEKMPLAVYALGDRIAVVSDWYGYQGNSDALTYTEYTSVDFFLVPDPVAPVFLASFGQDGLYEASRLTENGELILVTAFTPRHNDPTQPEGLVPNVYSGGAGTPLPADKVLLLDGAGKDPAACTVMGSYSIPTAGQNNVIAVPGLSKNDLDLQAAGLRIIRRRWSEIPSRVITENESEIQEFAVAACTDVYALRGENGGFMPECERVVNGWLPGASAISVQDGQIWYTASLCQGLYVKDSQGDILLRESVTGTRIGCWNELTGEHDNLDQQDPSVRWVGLMKDSAAFTTEEGVSYGFFAGMSDAHPLSEPLSGGRILPWGETGTLVFYQPDGGHLTVSVRDLQLEEVAARRFGSDHSNSLSSARSYFLDAEANLLGLAADDSYCLYGCTESEGLTFLTDVFLKDWAWRARAIRIGDRLVVADTAELFLFDVFSLELLASYEL